MKNLIIFLFAGIVASCNFAHAACSPVRDPDGKIHRSMYQVQKFRKANACPATGLFNGRCNGYQVDHVVPLECCGDDKPTNMQWLSIADHRAKTIIDNRKCRVRK